MKHKYIDLNNETKEYTIKDKISLKDRVQLIVEISNTVVSPATGYLSILEQPMYKYYLLTYFTDIKILDDTFDLDLIETFLDKNNEEIEYIIQNVDSDNSILKAVKMAIDYRINNLKISATDNLFNSLIDLINEFKDKELDTDLISELRDVLPKIEQMNNTTIVNNG